MRFVFTIFYTGNFQVPPEKNHPHLKCQFPPKSQFDLSPSYVNILKNGSAPQGGANYVIPNKKIRLKPDISNPISGIPNIILLYRAYIAILSLTCLRRHQKLWNKLILRTKNDFAVPIFLFFIIYFKTYLFFIFRTSRLFKEVLWKSHKKIKRQLHRSKVWKETLKMCSILFWWTFLEASIKFENKNDGLF